MSSSELLSWLRGIPIRVLRLSPKNMMELVLLKAFSQLCKIFAFLLPLKALLIAGSESLPGYMSWVSDQEDPFLAVVLMAVLAGGAYFLHLQIERYLKKQFNLIARMIDLPKCDTLVDPTVVVKRVSVIIQVCEMLSSILLMVMSAGLLLAINTVIGTGFVFVLMVMLVALFVSWNKHVRISNILRSDPLHCVNVCSSVLFFSGFSLLIVALLSGKNIEIMIAVVSLVVMRLFTSQVVVFVARARALIRQARFIETQFFFGGESSLGVVVDSHKDLKDLCSDFFGVQGGVRWMVSPLQGLDVVSSYVDRSGSFENHVLKKYSKKLIVNSEWESDLYELAGLNSGALSVVDECENNSWRLIYAGELRELKSSMFKAAANVFLIDLISSEPSNAAKNVHQEKHGGATDSYRDICFERIILPSMPEVGLDRVVTNWAEIVDYLSELPVQYVVKISKDTLLANQNITSVANLYWESWKIAPVGSVSDSANLPIDWESALKVAKSRRGNLERVSVEDLALSRAVSRFQNAMNRQRWGQACVELESVDVSWQAIKR